MADYDDAYGPCEVEDDGGIWYFPMDCGVCGEEMQVPECTYVIECLHCGASN